jgi:hypothetical protein
MARIAAGLILHGSVPADLGLAAAALGPGRLRAG